MRSSADTNVISAIWTEQPSGILAQDLLSEALRHGELVICGIVYAELLAHPMMDGHKLDRFLDTTGITLDDMLPKAVWRDAGIRFGRYAERRRRAHEKPSRRLVADFVIGAHALHRTDRLITFNGADFRRDFPELLVAPDSV